MKYLTAILFCFVSAAHAEFWDGNRLHQYLTSESVGERMAGTGYVVGVYDALNKVMHCPPENVTVGQVRDMVKNYLINSPAERHLTADEVVSKVLKTVWPCAPRNNGNNGRQL